jgi:hypothetical protein
LAFLKSTSCRVSGISHGERYIGGWLDDRRHGFGVVTTGRGSKYEGDWVRGKITAKGKLTLPNGSTFEGRLLGAFHGERA